MREIEKDHFEFWTEFVKRFDVDDRMSKEFKKHKVWTKVYYDLNWNNSDLHICIRHKCYEGILVVEAYIYKESIYNKLYAEREAFIKKFGDSVGFRQTRGPHGNEGKAFKVCIEKSFSKDSVGYPSNEIDWIVENALIMKSIVTNILQKDILLEEPYETIISGVEGKPKQYYVIKYERNPLNRKAALKLHGYKCAVCGFDFEKVYGELGKNFIEVHHTKPLYSLEEEVVVDPKKDLVCVCSNCHRMLHRKKGEILTVEELKKIVEYNISK